MGGQVLFPSHSPGFPQSARGPQPLGDPPRPQEEDPAARSPVIRPRRPVFYPDQEERTLGRVLRRRMGSPQQYEGLLPGTVLGRSIDETARRERKNASVLRSAFLRPRQEKMEPDSVILPEHIEPRRTAEAILRLFGNKNIGIKVINKKGQTEDEGMGKIVKADSYFDDDDDERMYVLYIELTGKNSFWLCSDEKYRMEIYDLDK